MLIGLSVLKIQSKSDNYFTRRMFRTVSQSGNISVMFCCIAVLLTVGLYYNVYIANSVKNLIRLQNSSDFSTYALGATASKGLNYISINNIAIASSLHIASSVPIIASYVTLMKVVSQTSPQIATDLVSGGYQSNWNRLKPFASSYMKIAAGASLFNESIAKSWLGYSLTKAEDIFQKNMGDLESNISFEKESPQQEDPPMIIDNVYDEKINQAIYRVDKVKKLKDTIETSKNKLDSLYSFRYEGISMMGSKDSVRMAFDASESVMGDTRSSPFFWASTVLPKSGLASATSALNNGVGKIIKYGALIPHIGFEKGGVKIKAGNVHGGVSNIDDQVKYFNEHNSRDIDIGFMIVDNKSDFDRSTSFKSIAMSETTKRLGLLMKIAPSTLTTNTYVKVVNNEPKFSYSMFYPNWYPIIIDELTN